MCDLQQLVKRRLERRKVWFRLLVEMSNDQKVMYEYLEPKLLAPAALDTF